MDSTLSGATERNTLTAGSGASVSNPRRTTAKESPVVNTQIQTPRSQVRADFRHRIQIIQLRDGARRIWPTITSGWIENISSTGAKLLIAQDVQDDRFWIRLNDGVATLSFIECQVCWRDVIRLSENRSACAPYNTCGVQFARTLNHAEFDEVLAVASMPTAGTAPVSAVPPPRNELTQGLLEESRTH